MEIKVLCNCGQKFKFDVEPVNGLMPFTVNCPVCATDNTAAANDILSGNVQPPPPSLSVTSPAPRLQINKPVYTEPPPLVSQMNPPTPRPISLPSKPAKSVGEFSLGMGIVGAFSGAALGTGAMIAFYMWAGFRFPWMGLIIGALTGYGAKFLSKGTETTLGVISGLIALLAVVGTLYLMYGVFPILSIISVIVSVSIAYRIASG